MVNHKKTSVLACLMASLLLGTNSHAMHFPPLQTPSLSEQVLNPFSDPKANIAYKVCLALGVLFCVYKTWKAFSGQESCCVPSKKWDPREYLATVYLYEPI